MTVKKFILRTLLLQSFVILLFADQIHSQDWARPVIKNQQRADLRDLGYPMVNEIPANSSAITSLLTAKNGLVYGCTSGEEAYLFLFDPATNKARHLGRIPGHTGVHHSLVEDRDGNIYIGAGKNIFEEVPLSKREAPGDKLDVTLWKDIKKYYSTYAGGRLYRYEPSSNQVVKLPDMNSEVRDLGMPRANNSIYALTVNKKGDEIYGLTYPDGHFFIYNIIQKKFTDLGAVDTIKVYHGPERDWRTLPRALVCDD